VENVPLNSEDSPEAISFSRAVREWSALDSDLKAHVRPILASSSILDGASIVASMSGTHNCVSGYSRKRRQNGKCQIQARRTYDGILTAQ
jgi:hypothetical protein